MELNLLARYAPLLEAEWQRIGISADDARWIFGGSDQRPTEPLLAAELEDLRALPTGYGVEAFCRHRGFDYHATKREVFGPPSSAS